jgi:hypothetical protein
VRFRMPARRARNGAALFRLFARVLAFLMIAGAFAAAVIDGARSIGADQLSLTPLGTTLFWAMPAKFPLLQPLIERKFGQFAWDHLLFIFLMAPTFVVLALAGALLLYLARGRPPTIGYSSRRR